MFLPISTWRSWPLGRNQSCQPVKEMLPLFLGLRLSFRVEAGPRSCDLLIQRWLMAGDGYFALQRRLLFKVARSKKDPRQVFLNNTWTWMVGCFLHLHADSFIFFCVYIYIYISVTCIIWYCYINVFCSFDKKLETQKSNTLKSAFPINSDGSWSDLTNCSSNMGSKASSCCVFFFGGGVEKKLDLKLAERFLGVSCLSFWCCFMSLLLRFLQSAFSIPIKL